MRRITIYADEENAKKAVGWLEEKGFDFMAEDYVEPSMRRKPPVRRPTPERSEEGPGILPPTLRPRPKPKNPREALLEWLREAGMLPRDSIPQLAKNEGWHPKAVMDTLRRMVKAGQIDEREFGDGGREYRLKG